MSKRWKWFGLSLVGLVGATLGLWWGVIKPVVEQYIIDEAQTQGVALRFGASTFSPFRVRLTRVTFRSEGDRAVRMRAERLELVLRGLKPDSVVIHGLDGQLSAQSWESLFRPRPASRPQASSSLPVRVIGANIELVPPGSRTAIAILNEATIATTAEGGALTTGYVSVDQVRIGPLQARWTAGARRVEIGVTAVAPGAVAPVQLEIEAPTGTAAWRVHLKSVLWSDLVRAMNRPALSSTLRVEGELTLRYAGAAQPEFATGEIRAKVNGYSIPMPEGMPAVSLGENVQIEGVFRIPRNDPRLLVVPLTVRSGPVSLRGEGSLIPVAGQPHLAARLRGRLGCANMAGAMARSVLGKTLGGFLNAVTQPKMAGFVSLDLAVQGNPLAAGTFQVKPTFGGSCGLNLGGGS